MSLILISFSSTLRKVAVLGATPNANENYEQNSKKGVNGRIERICGSKGVDRNDFDDDDDDDDDEDDDEDYEDDEDDCLAEVIYFFF